MRARSTTPAGLLNGDSARTRAVGRRRAGSPPPHSLRHLAGVPFDLALHTRFARTRETLTLLLGRRTGVRVATEAGFDDVDVGEFEGLGLQAYRDWRALHDPGQAVPGGESRLGALARYADGCARLLARHDARCVLLVVHDVPIRFLRNALLRADPLDGPVLTVANLERVTVGEAQLGAALAVMRRRLCGLPPV